MLLRYLFILLIIIPIKAFALIEVDITRGNLNPLPVAVSPLSIDDKSKENIWDILLALLYLAEERHKHINSSSIHEPSEVRIATESYKQNNDVIGQFINEKIIIDVEIREPRVTITKLYNDFRIWCASNVIKSKKCPDRNQLKAYFEKLLCVPYDNKGWRGIAYKLENEDDDN